MQTLTEYILSQGLSASTAAQYRRRITNWQASGLSAEEFVRCGKPNEAKGRLAAVNKLRDYHLAMQRAGHEVANVAPDLQDITLARPKPKPVIRLSQAECRALLNAAGETGARAALIVNLLYTQGMRLDEAINLRREDVNWGSGVISVKGKTGWREIPLHGATKAAIERFYARLKEPNASPYLLCGTQGQRTDPQALPRMCRKLYKKLEWQMASECRNPCHLLRHAFATHLYEQTGDILLVSKWLGHASVTTTMRYIGVDILDMQKAMDMHPVAAEVRVPALELLARVS